MNTNSYLSRGLLNEDEALKLILQVRRLLSEPPADDFQLCALFSP